MAKFRSPFNTNEVWITQTYHTQSNNTAVDFSAVAETPVYAMADGTVTYRSSGAGSYCIQTLDNSDLKIYYVHTHRWVDANTYVKKGQIICYVAPTSVNGGYPTHLHCGLPVGKFLMDYMDRSIVFRTKYQAIKDIWFIGENLNWSKHKDLSYENTVMNFKIGDNIEFTGEQSVRAGAGDKFASLRSSVIGEEGSVKDGPRSSQNAQFNKGVNDSYTWYDISFDNGSSGWVADVNKFKISVKPTEPPATTPIEECQKEVTRLKQELDASRAITASQEADLKDTRDSLEKLQIMFDGLQSSYNLLEMEKLDLQEELSRCKLELQEGKQSFIKKIVDAIGEWLGRIVG